MQRWPPHSLSLPPPKRLNLPYKLDYRFDAHYVSSRRCGKSERVMPLSFRGPCVTRAGFRVSGARKLPLHFVYLDEFGHIGPFMSRHAKRYNESPVFGLAGIILPEDAIRPFATRFLQLKQHVFRTEIHAAGIIAQHWEKHGTEIFTPKQVARYPHFRSTGFRLLNYIRDAGGKVFYYGREKISGTTNVNSTGLYTTILGHTIQQLESYAQHNNVNFVMVVDEHAARKTLLITAEKTMYGHRPAYHLLCPPFEVKSYINQNIQAADWIAAIVGRLWAGEVLPAQYRDHDKLRTYFWQRLHQLTTHSTVLPR